MNFVGPRSEIPKFVAKYSNEDRRIIFSVAPELTDFASIPFRNEEKLLAAQGNPSAYYERVLMRASCAIAFTSAARVSASISTSSARRYLR